MPAQSLALIRQELEEAQVLLQTFLDDKNNLEKIETAAQMMAEAIQQGKKIISAGNGGSHCDAMHFAEELSGRYREDRRALPGLVISDPSHLSCVSNDYGYDYVFARYLEALGQQGDVFLGISTSGNSKNILKAATVARQKQLKVVALTGKDGGNLAQLADIEIRVPHFGYADRIQEIHIKVIHILIMRIEQIVLNT